MILLRLPGVPNQESRRGGSIRYLNPADYVVPDYLFQAICSFFRVSFMRVPDNPSRIQIWIQHPKAGQQWERWRPRKSREHQGHHPEPDGVKSIMIFTHLPPPTNRGWKAQTKPPEWQKPGSTDLHPLSLFTGHQGGTAAAQSWFTVGSLVLFTFDIWWLCHS